MAELVWIPLYLDRLLGSPRWQGMKDFQRGWYMQLLLLCARSKRPGYLPLDGRLWEMAGAHSRAMWDSHSAAVMACFQTRTFDETEWIYNERLLHTIEHQHRKLSKSLELRNTAKNVSVSKNSFTKPSLEEIKAYCSERNNSVDPEAFYEHYETKGWLVGRTPMKDWQAAVRTWEIRDRKESGRDDRPHTPTTESVPEVKCSRCGDSGHIFNPGVGKRKIPCPDCA